MKEKGRKVIATNRKARHNYAILDTYEAGVALLGTEVKSLRDGKASLVDSFATIDDGEVWLRGLHIAEYGSGSWTNHSPLRNRKLLLHRREINKLLAAVEREGGRGQRGTGGDGLRAVALVEPFRLHPRVTGGGLSAFHSPFENSHGVGQRRFVTGLLVPWLAGKCR